VLREVADGVLAWEAEKTLPMTPLVIDTYEDHRMAMAFAPAVLKLSEIKINNPQVVTKSYPQYWKEFEKLLQTDMLGL
jgi:3-phosphoshikimate 1-carboxyvinyltransferase